MARDEDGRPPDVAEFDDPGWEDRLNGLWHRWPRLMLGAVVVTAVAVAAVLVTLARGGGSTSGPAAPPAGATGSSTYAGSMPTESLPTVTLSHGSDEGSSVSVDDLGHPLLGVHAGWELFGRGTGVVVCLQFARGLVVETTHPGLQSGGPVSFVATARGALVHPVDHVPGYLIPDYSPSGQGAREAPAELDSGGPVFPGPDPRHLWLWAQHDAGRASVVLVGLDGHRTARHIDLPTGAVAIPDQSGYMLLFERGGIYDVRPEASHRVTAGHLLAVGPTRWLTAERDGEGRWHSVVTNRSTGTHHPISFSAAVSSTGSPRRLPGVISPDGSVAAVTVGPPSHLKLVLVDLHAGDVQSVPIDLRPDGPSLDWQSMTWSPDSRWLFVVVDGDLRAVDRRTLKATDLSHALRIGLPPIVQLAVRPETPGRER